MANYRGCNNIEFIWHNTQADPDLIYRGYTFNYYDVEGALWNDFCEVTGTDYEDESEEKQDEYNMYVQDNAESYLNDLIFGGYFANDSKTWHNN